MSDPTYPMRLVLRQFVGRLAIVGALLAVVVSALDGSDGLIAVGGALQVAGVLAVVFEIRRNLRRAKAYYKRPKRVYARGIASAESAAKMTAIGGREPTLAERVERLERRVIELEDEAKEARKALIEGMRSEIGAVSKDIERWTSDWNEAIEGVLLELAEGSILLRYIGVAAIIAGVALSTIGGVLS